MCRVSTSLRKRVALQPGQRIHSPSGTPRLGRPGSMLVLLLGFMLGLRRTRSTAHTASLSHRTGKTPSSSFSRHQLKSVSVSKVGGIFVHKSEAGRFDEKSTTLVREVLMPEPLAADQEVITQQLADELSELIEAELREMVRTLQQAEPASLFAAAEARMRALAPQSVTKGSQQRPDQKTTATRSPAWPVPTASRPPAITTTATATWSVSSAPCTTGGLTTTAVAAARAWPASMNR